MLFQSSYLHADSVTVYIRATVRPGYVLVGFDLCCSMPLWWRAELSSRNLHVFLWCSSLAT